MALKLTDAVAKAHVFLLKGNDGLNLELYMRLADIQDSLRFSQLFLHHRDTYEVANQLHIADGKDKQFELKLVQWDDSAVLAARAIREGNPNLASFAYVPHANLFGNVCSRNDLCDAIGKLGFEVKTYRSIPSR